VGDGRQWISENRHLREFWDNGFEELQALPSKFRCKVGQSRDVAAGLGKAGDITSSTGSLPWAMMIGIALVAFFIAPMAVDPPATTTSGLSDANSLASSGVA
jgi:hypothetical protein